MVAVLGEVLWDVFPDQTVLGGAPFNVACHLHGFGQATLFISAIGQDALGDGILSRMQAWHIPTEGVAVLPDKPTGQVKIDWDDACDPTHHRFTILENQAYDAISAQHVNALTAQHAFSIRYFGSLILRAPTANHACQTFVNATHGPVFVDINLRAPWYSEATVRQALQGATTLKLNMDELKALTSLLALPSLTEAPRLNITPSINDDQAAAFTLMEHFSLDHVILTDGEKGAYWLHGRECYIGPTPNPFLAIKDTVGAGDAFSAVCILGLLHGWSIETTLTRAQQFASEICQLRGAIPSDQTLYQRLLTEWGA